MLALFGLVVVLAYAGATANADMIYACWDGTGDYLTIQEGIDAASDGDQVVVCDGVYTGPGNKNLDFSATQTDPADPCVFWGHHEWTDAAYSWRTWVARYENYNDADLNRDGAVDQADLGILLADWGCTSDCVGDIDGDDDTDQSDLGILLANWGDTCE